MLKTEKVSYYIRRFWQIPKIEKVLLVEGTFLIFFYYFLIQCVPLKYYLSIFKLNYSNRYIIKAKHQTLQIVRRTLNRIDRFIPGRYSCLVKALTFKMLLKSFGYDSEIKFTLNRGPGNILNAHAYVSFMNTPIFMFNRNLDRTIIPY